MPSYEYINPTTREITIHTHGMAEKPVLVDLNTGELLKKHYGSAPVFLNKKECERWHSK